MCSNVRIELGQPVRTWGGWYRHDKVLLANQEIGRIQVRRRHGRTESLTLFEDKCVLGSAVDWLVRMWKERQG
jgi:hypothetical protein